MRVAFSVLTLLAVSCPCSNAKTVVLFSPPHAANVRTYTNTGRALVAKGHDVYIPVPDFMLKEKMVNAKGINVIRYGEDLGHVDDRISATAVDNFWANNSLGPRQMSAVFELCSETVQSVMTDEKFIAKMKEIKPDLFVTVNVPPFRDILVLPYMLNIPIAFLGPFYDYIGARIPASFASSPTTGNDDFQEIGASFLQRLKNTAIHMMFMVMHIYVSSDEIVAKYAPNRPKISTNEIYNQAEIFLIETDFIMDYARPSLPNTVFVGSTAGNPPKELQEPFKSFMDKSKNGVIIVTFGSSVVEVPEYVSSKMVSAFQQLDLDVVWRVKLQSPDPNQILTSLWVPQNDLLAHKNTKLFVSHCGMNGQYEGFYHAVPTLCLPFFGDMGYNAQRSVVKGFGLQADIRAITDIELLALIKEMLDNKKYKENIQKASDLYKELYKLPVNETAYWLDHVMKYGGKHFRSAGQNMTMIQFLSIDIFLFFTVVICVSTCMVYTICIFCCRLCYGKTGKSKND